MIVIAVVVGRMMCGCVYNAFVVMVIVMVMAADVTTAFMCK